MVVHKMSRGAGKEQACASANKIPTLNICRCEMRMIQMKQAQARDGVDVVGPSDGAAIAVTEWNGTELTSRTQTRKDRRATRCASGSPVGNGHPRLRLPALDVLEEERKMHALADFSGEPTRGTYGDGVRLDGGECGRDDGDEGEEEADGGLHCFGLGAGSGVGIGRVCGEGAADRQGTGEGAWLKYRWETRSAA